MELLAAEMWALKLGQETINPFIKHDDRELIHAVIEGASTGNLADRERNHIASRARQAEANRVGQVEHMKNEHRTKSYLKTVSPEHMPKWLDQETSGQVAREHLAWEIMQYFPEATKEEADEYAVALQRSASCRMTRGLIRRTLYYNWRCAHRGSVPPDLYFDSNHVINSTYCEVYATEEAGQLDYAKYLLTTATAVAIYNRSEFPSISDWLLSLAG